jgi:hypothetical protein
VWINKDDNETRIIPRVYQEDSQRGLGAWGIYAEFGKKDRGSGIIVDLRVLSD